MLSPVWTSVWDGTDWLSWHDLWCRYLSPLCIRVVFLLRVVFLPATACTFAALCCLYTRVQYRIDVVDAIGISFCLASVCMTVEAVPWLSCLFVSCVFPAESYKPGKSWDPRSLCSLLFLSETFTVLLTPHVCTHLAHVVGWLRHSNWHLPCGTHCSHWLLILLSVVLSWFCTIIHLLCNYVSWCVSVMMCKCHDG